jgi:predicted membrane channel-forming protein YqfA (hemolysin III family)
MVMLILTLALIGFVVYLITTYIPMPAPFKTVIYVIVAVVLILYLMSVFGISDIPIPRAR